MRTITIIGFEPRGRRTTFKLEYAPTDIPDEHANVDLDLTPLPEGTLDVRGQALVERLSRHQPVRDGLAAALAQPVGAGPHALYFRMASASADELPWEQIYDAARGFCVLDQRWPIARIARRQRELNDRVFTRPLRLLAVLSAGPRRSGLHQLRTLLTVAGSVDAAAVGVQLHVLSGEEAVLAEATGAGLRNVTSERIAATPQGLANQIIAAKPQLVHVLCHGGAAAGVRTLALATLADFDAEEELGSVRLKAPDLATALYPSDPWLAVLAACDTADAADGMPPLAHDIVNQGVPAVIGMRRPVDLGVTNQFCAGLYPQLLTIVRAAVSAAAGPPVPRTIDWAPALSLPRMTISGRDPCTVDVWSDPVLYVQSTPLRVVTLSPALSPEDYARRRAKLDVWEGQLAILDPRTANPAYLAEVREQVAELRAALGLDGLDGAA